MVKVKLLQNWQGADAGSVVEVTEAIAERLIADRFAVKAGASASRRKVAAPSARKTG